MDVTKLLANITELMEEAEAEAARGGRLHKAGANAHATTKSDHHEKMAEVCAKMADLHASMSDHYKSGAKGVHVKASKVDDVDGAEGEDVEGADKEDAKKSAGYGALDSIRARPSRKREGVSRTELAEMFAEREATLVQTLVKIFTPPAEREQTGDELAAVKLLQAQGYVVRLGDEPVRKAVVVDGRTAPDKEKVVAADPGATAGGLDEQIRVLKAKISVLEASALSNPSAAAEAAEARVKLDTLAKAAIREALHQPHVASSGEAAGYRGLHSANL